MPLKSKFLFYFGVNIENFSTADLNLFSPDGGVTLFQPQELCRWQRSPVAVDMGIEFKSARQEHHKFIYTRTTHIIQDYFGFIAFYILNLSALQHGRIVACVSCHTEFCFLYVRFVFSPTLVTEHSTLTMAIDDVLSQDPSHEIC